jgi:hypothetical protein
LRQTLNETEQIKDKSTEIKLLFMQLEILLGLIGFLFVIISFLQKSMKKLYFFNIIATFFLGLYAYLIKNWIFFPLEIVVLIVVTWDYLKTKEIKPRHHTIHVRKKRK